MSCSTVQRTHRQHTLRYEVGHLGSETFVEATQTTNSLFPIIEKGNPAHPLLGSTSMQSRKNTTAGKATRTARSPRHEADKVLNKTADPHSSAVSQRIVGTDNGNGSYGVGRRLRGRVTSRKALGSHHHPPSALSLLAWSRGFFGMYRIWQPGWNSKVSDDECRLRSSPCFVLRRKRSLVTSNSSRGWR